MSERKFVAPCLNEFRGPLQRNGSYELKIFTIGPLTGKFLRDVIRMLEMTASWLEEDDKPDRFRQALEDIVAMEGQNDSDRIDDHMFAKHTLALVHDALGTPYDDRSAASKELEGDGG